MISIRTVVFLLFAFVYNLKLVSSEDARGCDLNVNKDLPDSNKPLLLKKINKQYELLVPTVKRRQGIIELEKGEELVLACPGPKNHLQETRQNSTTTSCIEGTSFAAGKITVDTRSAQCAQPVMADISETRDRCSQEAKIYEVGFKVHVSQTEDWHRMFDVCHDTSSSNTLYSKHVLIGAAIRGAEQESARPRFSKGNLNKLYEGFNPDTYYTKESQKKLITKILGREMLDTYFKEDSQKFLTRGHLAPDGDFLFGSWQFSTYFFINAAPQWQCINAGNWLSIEKLVRKKAMNLQDNLIVITGTYGILELYDRSNKAQKIYLNYDKKKIPVPEYFWKVLHHPKSRQGIAFLTSNNPFTKANSSRPLCNDICQSSNWANEKMSQEFIRPEQGLTTCCAVSDIRKTISHVPVLDIDNVLNF